MSALLAKRIAEEQVFGKAAAPTISDSWFRPAQEGAIQQVTREHDQELKDFKDQNRKALDNMLARFENARQTRGQHRQEFARTASSGKAKTDFGKAARDDPASEARKPQHSPAIARAIGACRELAPSKQESTTYEPSLVCKLLILGCRPLIPDRLIERAKRHQAAQQTHSKDEGRTHK